MLHWAAAATELAQIGKGMRWIDAALQGFDIFGPGAARAGERLLAARKRLIGEMDALRAFQDRVDAALALLPEVCAQIMAMSYAEGLTDAAIGARIYRSRHDVEHKRAGGGTAVYIAVRTMEALSPCGYPLFRRWIGQEGCPMPPVERKALRAALYIWGVAPERIAALSDQLGAGGQGEDAARILTAVEWYARIWDGVDRCMLGLTRPAGRMLAVMRYRERAPYNRIARVWQCEIATCQEYLYGVIQEIAGRIDPDVCRLAAWRLELRAKWGGRVEAPVRGFDGPLAALPVRELRQVRHEEIARLLAEPGYKVSMDRLMM